MVQFPSQETFDGTKGSFLLHVMSLLFFNTKGIYMAKYLWSQSHVCSITAGSHRDGCFVTKQICNTQVESKQ